MRTIVNLRVSQKLIFDEVDASFAARASRFKYSTSENVKRIFLRQGICTLSQTKLTKDFPMLERRS